MPWIIPHFLNHAFGLDYLIKVLTESLKCNFGLEENKHNQLHIISAFGLAQILVIKKQLPEESQCFLDRWLISQLWQEKLETTYSPSSPPPINDNIGIYNGFKIRYLSKTPMETSLARYPTYYIIQMNCLQKRVIPKFIHDLLKDKLSEEGWVLLKNSLILGQTLTNEQFESLSLALKKKDPFLSLKICKLIEVLISHRHLLPESIIEALVHRLDENDYTLFSTILKILNDVNRFRQLKFPEKATQLFLTILSYHVPDSTIPDLKTEKILSCSIVPHKLLLPLEYEENKLFSSINFLKEKKAMHTLTSSMRRVTSEEVRAIVELIWQNHCVFSEETMKVLIALIHCYMFPSKNKLNPFTNDRKKFNLNLLGTTNFRTMNNFSAMNNFCRINFSSYLHLFSTFDWNPAALHFIFFSTPLSSILEINNLELSQIEWLIDHRIKGPCYIENEEFCYYENGINERIKFDPGKLKQIEQLLLAESRLRLSAILEDFSSSFS